MTTSSWHARLLSLHHDSLQKEGISSSVGTIEGYPVPFSRAAIDTVGRSPMAHGETPVKS